MATSVSTAPPVTPRQRSTPRLSYNAKWAISFLIAAVAIFLLYQYLLPNLNDNINSFFDDWLPMSVVDECMVWVICALGLNVVVGYAGLLDLGFVAFWAIGGYVAGWLFSGFIFGVSWSFFGSAPAGAPGVHVNFWFVLIVAGAVCAVAGILIGAPTLRLKSDYLALVTLGFGEIIPQFFRNGDDIFGHNLDNGTRGITPTDQISGPGFKLGPFDLEWQFLVMCVLVAFVVFVSLRLRVGRLGRAWLAIREDELAASMMGVPLMRTKLAAYGVGAVAGGLGGVAFAAHINAVIPDRFDFSISITLLAMVVLGGMGNVWGVMVGALVLAWINAQGLKQVGSTFNDTFGTNINFPSYNYGLFGLILVLMMLFRREGLIPEARTKLLLREPDRGLVSAHGIDLEDAADQGLEAEGLDHDNAGAEEAR
jgi:branched-chain amino acid transport system permease protein